MDKLIRNQWRTGKDGVETASILQHEVHPEGLDFLRVRFPEGGSYRPHRDLGGQFSVVGGRLQLSRKGAEDLQLGTGCHLYMPPGYGAELHAEPGTELIMACAPKASRARGSEPLLRDDQFLSACARPEQALRWILTPQYLSRRVFLHHDRTLVSRAGEPVSWFHTTMFDVDGLPTNDEGRPVFKMSYNFRTEPNVCYQVEGVAEARMALHPYIGDSQNWGPWHSIDGDCTYHLNEDPSQTEWELRDGGRHPLRNKHEVRIERGFVSLICMHDPAPTGAERHAAGEYSAYGDLADTLGTEAYHDYLAALAPFEKMVDELSLAKARGLSLEAQPAYALYQEGRSAQRRAEARLREELVAEGQGRERIVEAWMLPAD